MAVALVHYRERQRLLTADFVTEQDYRLGLAGRHHLGPHRWGVVRGLALVRDVDGWILEPGLAIDGYGRETGPGLDLEVHVLQRRLVGVGSVHRHPRRDHGGEHGGHDSRSGLEPGPSPAAATSARPSPPRRGRGSRSTPDPEIERGGACPPTARGRSRRRSARPQPTLDEDGHRVGEAPGLAEEVGAEHDRAPVLGGQPAIISTTSRLAAGSRPEVGSSRNRSSGSCSSARARATRLRSPVEKPRTRLSARSPMPSRSRSSPPPPGRRRGRRSRSGRRSRVLPGGQPVVEAGVLGEDAGAPAQLVAGRPRVEPEHRGGAGVGAEDAVQQPHRGGLAGAVGAQQGQHLARRRPRQRQAVEGDPRVEAAGQL